MFSPINPLKGNELQKLYETVSSPEHKNWNKLIKKLKKMIYDNNDPFARRIIGELYVKYGDIDPTLTRLYDRITTKRSGGGIPVLSSIGKAGKAVNPIKGGIDKLPGRVLDTTFDVVDKVFGKILPNASDLIMYAVVGIVGYSLLKDKLNGN